MPDESSGAVSETVQRQIESIVSEFEALGVRLRAIHASLPVSPREDLMLLGEEDPDFSCTVRGAIECGLNDHLELFLQSLLTAAKPEVRRAKKDV